MNRECHMKCYRTACTNNADPRCWNRITNGMYCRECACLITNRREAVRGPLFPYMNLPSVETGQWTWPCVRIRPEQMERRE